MDIITKDELKKSDKGYSFTVYSRESRLFHIVDKASDLVGDTFNYRILREFLDRNGNPVKIAKLVPHKCEFQKVVGKDYCSRCDCGKTLPHKWVSKIESSDKTCHYFINTCQVCGHIDKSFDIHFFIKTFTKDTKTKVCRDCGFSEGLVNSPLPQLDANQTLADIKKGDWSFLKDILIPLLPLYREYKEKEVPYYDDRNLLEHIEWKLKRFPDGDIIEFDGEYLRKKDYRLDLVKKTAERYVYSSVIDDNYSRESNDGYRLQGNSTTHFYFEKDDFNAVMTDIYGGLDEFLNTRAELKAALVEEEKNIELRKTQSEEYSVVLEKLEEKLKPLQDFLYDFLEVYDEGFDDLFDKIS
jgi:hypothetical protein